MPESPKHPQEKYGYNVMVAGFVLVLLAGAAYFVAPRATEPVYGRIGNYLMAIGLAVYVAGRIIKAQGKRLREKGIRS